ncbi:MAG: LysM peptidoglycan-binding domain-containing protein [Anaerolineae bacterium]|nr:LysM peptidoglycan-binding domain-containing protein [Anaerolineae bacterium]MCX8068737.1 LysM peptidoglycan-binding domain-containing protein [Anaerolineae bacterium]MDW7992451.1 LysM peptidoglycan-binding domain-containing protein [Anaerolineae bacterium]
MHHASCLQGKGLWLSFSGDLDGALEMAAAIGATHLIYRVGMRGMFFVEAARWVEGRARQAGLVPLAWVPLALNDPFAEASLVLKALQVGYNGAVLEVRKDAAGKTVAAATLARQLLESGAEKGRLYCASDPDVWRRPEIPCRELSQACQGGLMPFCFPSLRRTPHTVVEKWAYGECVRCSQEWGGPLPIYPVLSPLRDEGTGETVGVEEFLQWAQAVAGQQPEFFSVYRVGAVGRELWPILAAMGPTPAPFPERKPAETPPAEEPSPLPSIARYHVVTVNDTLWGICQRYGITRAQFWEWNGHLWDERGLPRDELYMEAGWRVRVG